jgi:hypothetical protein
MASASAAATKAQNDSSSPSRLRGASNKLNGVKTADRGSLDGGGDRRSRTQSLQNVPVACLTPVVRVSEARNIRCL